MQCVALKKGIKGEGRRAQRERLMARWEYVFVTKRGKRIRYAWEEAYRASLESDEALP